MEPEKTSRIEGSAPSTRRVTWQRGHHLSIDQYKRLTDPTHAQSRHSNDSRVLPTRRNSEPGIRHSANKLKSLALGQQSVTEHFGRQADASRDNVANQSESPRQNIVDTIPLEGSANAVIIEEEEVAPPPPYSSLHSQLENTAGGDTSSPYDNNRPLYSDAPPSYSELFSQSVRMRARQLSVVSTRAEQYINESKWKKVVLSFGAVAAVALFAVALPICMITIGVRNIDNCPAEPNVPIFLIVGGVIQALECSICLTRCVGMRDTQRQQDEAGNNRRRKRWDPCLYLAIICFILSSIYVFKAEPVFDHRDVVAGQGIEKLYCDKTAFSLAFWLIGCYYMIFVFSFGLMLVAIMIGAVFAYRDQQTTSVRFNAHMSSSYNSAMVE
ncbi:uncharacterized protein LOC116602161 [Nematostella vectensis]|uniref:uncharacterized protein LOC116602161 n=1 Tax=Nematostella vectensis TaxID=45351 RepID=UPI0020770D29|nr:uncharacterized protein LOC116602161 [Nematostella vectensis]